jgi:hypothetical protein
MSNLIDHDKAWGLTRTIVGLRLLCRLGAFLGLFLVMTGCEELKGPSADHGLFAARLQDCKPGYIPPRDNFGPGETPAIIFGFQNGRTVTVRITDLNNGGIVWNNTAYIPRDNITNWWSLKALPGGVYKAELLAGNTLLQSYNFNVAKAPAKKR